MAPNGSLGEGHLFPVDAPGVTQTLGLLELEPVFAEMPET